MTTQSFIIIPKAVLASPALSALQREVLALLADHTNPRTGQCNPRRETLAKAMNLSVHQVARCLIRLREVGLIQSAKGQRGNTYVVKPRSEWVRILDSAVRSAHSAPCGQRTAEPPHPYMNQTNRTNTTPPVPPSHPVDAVETPDEAAAATLFSELAETHPQPGQMPRAATLLNAILRGGAKLERIRTNHQRWLEYWRLCPNGTFIPQLWRWLRDGEWMHGPSPLALEHLRKPVRSASAPRPGSRPAPQRIALPAGRVASADAEWDDAMRRLGLAKRMKG